MSDSAAVTGLKQTALHDLHVEQGARMVEFAGYSMPVQYPLGVKKEHEHTRAKAGLFDVSHMGQLILRGENVQAALEALPGPPAPVPTCAFFRTPVRSFPPRTVTGGSIQASEDVGSMSRSMVSVSTWSVSGRMREKIWRPVHRERRVPSGR